MKKFKLISLVVAVFCIGKADLSCDLRDKNYINALEKYVNYSIPDKFGHFRVKLYSLFDKLKEHSLIRPGDNIPPNVSLLFVLINQSLNTDFISSTRGPNPGPNPRFRRSAKDNCKELGFKYNRVIDKMAEEVEKLNKLHSKQVEYLKPRNCDIKCDLLCLKLQCPTVMGNCANMRNKDTCETRIPCPEGFTAHWLEQPSKSKIEEESKFYNGHSWNKDDKNVTYRDRQFDAFDALKMRYPVKKLGRDLNLYVNVSNLNDETIAKLFEILDYYKEDVTPLKDGVILPYRYAVEILNRSRNKEKIIRDGIIAIIAHLSPLRDVYCQKEFIEESKKPLSERPFSKFYQEIEKRIILGLKVRLNLGDGCDLEKCRQNMKRAGICAEIYEKKLDCSFECPNSKDCGYHQCRRVVYMMD